MVSNKIKALFQFIEYLHSNIDNFNKYNNLIKELEILKHEKNRIRPEKNYKDKLKYNEVQAELENKFKELQDNTANLIKGKAKELNVCNFDNEPNYSFNGIETEIHQLKNNFSNKDLPEIFNYKTLYLEYRINTHKTFLSLQFFFNDLDEITKSLFDYFKETELNEYEALETKTTKVNDISEAVEYLKKGTESNENKTAFNTPFNGMFAISRVKEKFSKIGSDSITHFNKTSEIHKYELRNENIFDTETKELIKVEFQSVYNSGFLITLSKMYVLDIHLFLDHQLKHSKKPKEFIQYVKYSALHTEIIKSEGTKEAIKDWLINNTTRKLIKGNTKETPKNFEELFYNPNHAEICLTILREITPPVLDAKNNYIGKGKGIFPLWIKVLVNHKPQPLIKHFKDSIYKDLLNKKIKDLNLTADASEFRKNYKRLENNNVELDIKTILSQYSQSGKLGI